MIEFKEIKTDQELKAVLEMCYRILGNDNAELYGYEAWSRRLRDGKQPLLYACNNEKVVSAVLGRAENKDSLVIGFVACDENHRKQGITKKLMKLFEEKARELGYKYITLGSKEDAFYEKCGYKIIFEINGQNIYQKVLRGKAMTKFEFMNSCDILSDGEITLRISQKYQGDDELLPFYYYDICIGDTPIGKISIRIGNNYHSYYNGHIGYEIDKEHRGNNYAYRACMLVLRVAKAHSMCELILTCDESNISSYKTIEKLGANLIEIVKPPKNYFAYREDMEKQRIYKLCLKE